MPRKVSPAALGQQFRPTQVDDETLSEPEAQPPGRRPTGRIRHDEKITVYVSSSELLALEQARLTLRAEHGIAVDRGRIVREAVGAMIDGLEQHGAGSELVARLRAT